MRYVILRRPRSNDEEYYEEEGFVPDLTVYDSDDYVSTGLLNEDGDEIFRQVRNPIGFLADQSE